MNENKIKKILLIEKDHKIAINQKEILEKYGYSVDIVKNGEFAIDYIKNNSLPDLILMEIDLEESISNIKVAETILKENDIPLLFLLSSTSKEIFEKIENINSYGFLLKNGDENILINSIKTALRLFYSRKTEKEKEQNYYREIFNAIKDAIFIDDASNGKIIDVNESMLKMYGYDNKEEVLKGNIGDLSANVEPYTEEVAQKLIRKAIEECPQTFEWLAKKKNGEIFWVEVSLKRTDILGKSRVIAVVKDISDRKKIEQRLEETIQLLSLFIKNSPIYAFIKEVKEDDSRVLYASENYIDMIGIPGSKMKGMNMFELFPPDFAKKITEDDWYVVSKDEIIRLYEDFNNKNYITVKFPIIQKEKKYLAGYTIEITDLRKSENQIKELLKEKELILKEVHHRIKNNITTLSSLVSIESNKQTDPEIRSVLNDIKSKFQNFKILYEKVYQADNYTNVSIRDYITELIKNIAEIFDLNNIVTIEIIIENIILNTKIASTLGLIINELITNSMKYAFKNIENPKISLKIYNNASLLIIEYMDNGIGIPDNISFDNTEGFGLQLIYMLTQQLRGKVDLIRGKGTKFIIQFQE